MTTPQMRMAALLIGISLCGAAAAAPYDVPGTPTEFHPSSLVPLAGDEDARPMIVRTSRAVAFETQHPPGSIIISTSRRLLHFVTGNGQAIQYRIAVGKDGFAWVGQEKVTRKAMWPDWRPPAEMRQRRPGLPALVEGGPNNPLGARAIYLGSTLYRIHGSNEPGTIGQAVSSGCIRLSNEDVIDLYERVSVGASVVVAR